MTEPSPAIAAAAMRNAAWYDTEDAYLVALGRALQVEYETIVSHGFVLGSTRPISRWNGAFPMWQTMLCGRNWPEWPKAALIATKRLF